MASKEQVSLQAEVNQARRRIALALAGTPFAGAASALAAPLQAPGGKASPGPHGTPAPTPQPVKEAPASELPITGRWTHGFAAYGQPKYGPDYTHFEYVDPDAPKGGKLRLGNPGRATSFDKYNPWTTRGSAPAGVAIWMFEGLCYMAMDEPASVYGLLAEAMYVEPDFSAVSFRLRREARFNNGDPVTPADVVHSFTMLSGKGASPAFQSAVAPLARALVVDERTVRFEFAEKSRDHVATAGTLPIFSRKWGAGKPFDQVTDEYPITTGPYLIDKVDMPRRIEFRRNPAYWAGNLPVRRGHFNFDRVIYRNYQEQAVAREAFKTGEVDIYKEYGARSWLRLHAGPKWDDGRIVRHPMETAFGEGLQAYYFNLRLPKFQDIRVREAISLSFDFDTRYRTGAYKPAYSLFNNSEFAAVGPPSAAELKLLEPFRAELPPRVFGPPWRRALTGRDPKKLRANLLQARALLEQAGWKPDANSVLRNSRGESLEFEYLTTRTNQLEDWQLNLQKLGITMKERIVDFALFRRRLEKYDFETITIAGGSFTLPGSAELTAAFGSKSADEEGNNNFRGVKSRAVDHILEALSRANTLDELRAAARALDRVVVWSFWQVADLYSNNERISHWNRFGIPKVQAKYFAADTYFSVINEYGPWPLWCWWDSAVDRRMAPLPGAGGASK